MTDTLMYSSEKPPFKLTVSYTDEGNFLVWVKHDDGRHMRRSIVATYEPRFGIDVADQFEIDKAAEEMCVAMESYSAH